MNIDKLDINKKLKDRLTSLLNEFESKRVGYIKPKKQILKKFFFSDF